MFRKLVRIKQSACKVLNRTCVNLISLKMIFIINTRFKTNPNSGLPLLVLKKEVKGDY
jgi:hypothetical protein